jgi:hypothetical protein
MAKNAILKEIVQLKIIRTIFQDCESRHNADESKPKFIIVLDMEDKMELSTSDIENLTDKLNTALPGIFPNETDPLVHSCGGPGTDVEKHTFHEEMERGTNIPHLLEHVLLYLLSRRSNYCSAYCGQRSVDIENGITTHYYLILEYPSKLEAVVATDLAFQMVSAWVEGKTVTIDPKLLLEGILQTIEPMVRLAA